MSEGNIVTDTNTFTSPWHGVTTLHPLGVLAVILMGILMLIVSRRMALVPMLILACFVASAQRVVILSLDFNLMRILIMVGWARILLYREYRDLHYKPIDGMMIAWTLIGTISITLLYVTSSVFLNRLGVMLDALGMYFLVRCLVRNWDDVEAIAIAAAVISVPVAFFFIIEKSTGRNMFYVFGGVPEFTAIRQGRLRCQGAFAHPILAGCFWASLTPLMAALWWRTGYKRLLAPIGTGCAMIIVVACSSSTPIAVVIVGAATSLLFPLRNSIRWLTLGIVATLTILHFSMRAPVWHLFTNIDFVGGSTGWHRYKLVDEFINHFSDWWLVGSKNYGGWFEWGLSDLTNQYVATGLHGGLFTLALFLGVIYLAATGIARSWKNRNMTRADRVMAWAVFVTLVIHCFAFLAVSYFQQIVYIWYMSLGIIASMTPLRTMSKNRKSTTHRLPSPSRRSPTLAASR